MKRIKISKIPKFILTWNKEWTHLIECNCNCELSYAWIYYHVLVYIGRSRLIIESNILAYKKGNQQITMWLQSIIVIRLVLLNRSCVFSCLISATPVAICADNKNEWWWSNMYDSAKCVVEHSSCILVINSIIWFKE